MVNPVSEKPPVVELRNVLKTFPEKHGKLIAVDHVSLSITDGDEGEFVALLGPSGCGKSTILNLIAGLLEPDEGEVLVFGNRVVGPEAQAVTVQQSYTCFPWLTVLGNVEFGLLTKDISSSERQDVAMEYLRKVGLEDRARAYPKELSGGMQQRTAIARALAMKPSIILMDEPFGALDAQTRAEMQQMLLKLWADEKNLVIFVTHDINEAILLADRVVLFSARPAKIVYDAHIAFARPRLPELMATPQFNDLSQALLKLLKGSSEASHPS